MTGQFLDCLDRFFQRARSFQGPFDTGVCKVECYELILAGLQSVIDAGLAASNSQSPRATRGTDVVCKAKEFIAANLACELTADVIATSLGVSYRALNYAFLDALGVTPYQYLLTARLHGVRRMLKSSDPTITEACFANGFSTPSRFSRQYKRLFGELPSETKKRSRFCPVKCD